ncbi:MAG: hypothetical protein FWG16_04560 [Micrococcales bacterium]|nr:hypothetical protein [Micrococcales bacterium]
MTPEPFDSEAAKAIAASPMPTKKTLKRRKNVFFQFVRFVAINLRMMRVIRRSHHA